MQKGNLEGNTNYLMMTTAKSTLLFTNGANATKTNMMITSNLGNQILVCTFPQHSLIQAMSRAFLQQTHAIRPSEQVIYHTSDTNLLRSKKRSLEESNVPSGNSAY